MDEAIYLADISVMKARKSIATNLEVFYIYIYIYT